jgi:hypothetical protein
MIKKERFKKKKGEGKVHDCRVHRLREHGAKAPRMRKVAFLLCPGR